MMNALASRSLKRNSDGSFLRGLPLVFAMVLGMGSAASAAMGMAAAGRYLDLRSDDPGLVPDVSSVNGMGGRNWRRGFQHLELGEIVIDNPSILILDDAQMREMGTELILGMDLLRKLHLYIAYGEEKVYHTPAGAN